MDLGHVTINIVVWVVQLDDVVAGLLVSAVGYKPVWRSEKQSAPMKFKSSWKKTYSGKKGRTASPTAT